jgi:hypothetical protein
MLIGKTTPTQEQEGTTRRKGKAKANDEGDLVAMTFHPQKGHPFGK